jgi:hypothetical protein
MVPILVFIQKRPLSQCSPKAKEKRILYFDPWFSFRIEIYLSSYCQKRLGLLNKNMSLLLLLFVMTFYICYLQKLIYLENLLPHERFSDTKKVGVAKVIRL